MKDNTTTKEINVEIETKSHETEEVKNEGHDIRNIKPKRYVYKETQIINACRKCHLQ